MADNSLVALTDSDNEVQAQQTPERTTIPSASPNRDLPEPLYHTTGEARVIRTRRWGAGSSRADPYANYTGNPSIRMSRTPLARRWDWLPTTLNTWRSEEEIQIPADPWTPLRTLRNRYTTQYRCWLPDSTVMSEGSRTSSGSNT